MNGIKEEIFETLDYFVDPVVHLDVKNETEVDPTFSIHMEEEANDLISDWNPWVSKDLKKFLFYHCPECEFQSPVEDQFYLHAVNNHEKAKEVFEEPECYYEPLLVDFDPSKPVNTFTDWYVYPNQPPNSVHTLTNDNLIDSTVLEEKLESVVAEEFSELHMEPLYHNSIERAEKFIEDQNQKMNLVCPLCQKNLKSRQLFDLHQATLHNWTLFETKESCVKSDTKKKEVLIYQEKGRFPCPFKCGTSFKNQQTLRSHLIYDPDTKCIKACKGTPKVQKKFECPSCNKECRSRKILKIHMKKKHGGLSCHHCGKTYSTIEVLRRHIHKQHGGPPPPQRHSNVICEHCGKSVSSNVIDRHVDYFHSEGDVICEECGESFQSKFLLASHQTKVHSVMVKCDFPLCRKQFKTQANLDEHKRLAHQDISKRFCEFCRKTFTNGAELFKHFNDAHPEFECPAKLGADFYQCQNCHKILASQAALYTHLKLTHKIRYQGHELLKLCDQVPTKCPECQQISNSYMECVNHYIDNHGPDLHKELKNQGNRDRLLYCLTCDFKTRLAKSYFNHRKLH